MKKLAIPIFVSCLVVTINAQASVVAQRNEKSHNGIELPANGAAIEEVVVQSSLHIKPKARTSVRRVRSVLSDELNDFVDYKRVRRQFGNSRPSRVVGFGSPGFGVDRGVGAGTSAAANLGNDGGAQASTNVEVGPGVANAGANVDFNTLNELAADGRGQSQAQSLAAAHNQFNSHNGGFGASAANAQGQAFQSQGAAGSFGASSAGAVTQNLQSNRFGSQTSAGVSLSQVYKLPNGQTINFAATNSFANGPFSNTANSRGGAVSLSRK